MELKLFYISLFSVCLLFLLLLLLLLFLPFPYLLLTGLSLSRAEEGGGGGEKAGKQKTGRCKTVSTPSVMKP